MTWTSTHGPIPCAPQITCTCALPPKPPVIDSCPYKDCHGETLTWDDSEEGPSKCMSTCTVELPSVAVPQTEAPTVYATPTPEAPAPEQPTDTLVTVPVGSTPESTPESSTTSEGPALQTTNAAPLERGSWAAAAVAAAFAAFL